MSSNLHLEDIDYNGIVVTFAEKRSLNTLTQAEYESLANREQALPKQVERDNAHLSAHNIDAKVN